MNINIDVGSKGQLGANLLLLIIVGISAFFGGSALASGGNPAPNCLADPSDSNCMCDIGELKAIQPNDEFQDVSSDPFQFTCMTSEEWASTQVWYVECGGLQTDGEYKNCGCFNVDRINDFGVDVRLYYNQAGVPTWATRAECAVYHPEASVCNVPTIENDFGQPDGCIGNGNDVFPAEYNTAVCAKYGLTC